MAAASSSSLSNTLLTIVVDVSPSAWGDRDVKRTERDQQRTSVQKRSIGPAILDELVQSLCAYIVAITSMERNASIIIIGVANNESAILFPRNDSLNAWLQSTHGYAPNIRTLQQDFITGISELVHLATTKATAAAAVHHVDSQTNKTGIVVKEAAMACAFSKALCVMNRLLVAAQSGYGVSALSSTTSQFLDAHPDQDHGVIALMMSHNNNNNNNNKDVKKSKAPRTAAATWSPRILMVQVSPDRSYDYNAFMNCAFAAAKHNITVDGCYLSSELTSSTNTSSSSFLEQTCDITGGIYLAPSGAAQVGGALTAVLFAVFLAPIPCRPLMNLPSLHKVDYRARCFDTGETVDMAYVCNQCLSIFKERPHTYECSTCHAPIVGNEKLTVTET